jgi:hypothetical protein
MPGRSSSRSSSSRRSSSLSHNSSRNSSYSYSSPKSPIIAPTPTPIVQHNHQLQQPGFFSNVFQGFGLGAGQSIAMNIFRSDPKVTHVHENAPSSSTPSLEKSLPKEFVQCMKENNNDKDLCKQYLE